MDERPRERHPLTLPPRVRPDGRSANDPSSKRASPQRTPACASSPWRRAASSMFSRPVSSG